MLTRDLLEFTWSASKSSLRARLEGAGVVSSEGELSQFISEASFNVPSALHASPTGFVVSCWTRVSIRSSSVFESVSVSILSQWRQDLRFCVIVSRRAFTSFAGVGALPPGFSKLAGICWI